MNLDNITLKPIGIINTPFTDTHKMPIQPIAAKGIQGFIELKPEFIEGLKDLEGFSHIILIYYFHKIKDFELIVKPFLDTEKHGVFACKAPVRPNPIGISTVKLIKIENNIIYVEEVDMLNKTPLLDIKPYYPKFDNRSNVRVGWLENKKNIPAHKLRSDHRFIK